MSTSEFIRDIQRTHSCGQLTAADIGKTVVLFGWVATRRDHGGAVFIDLRDRDGITQVVFDREESQAAHAVADQLRGEYVVGVEGVVVDRGANRNAKLKTGEIEVRARKAVLFNKAATPPFLIEDGIDTAENVRLEYRYLDLRRPEV